METREYVDEKVLEAAVSKAVQTGLYKEVPK
jgi:hypothetical protein